MDICKACAEVCDAARFAKLDISSHLEIEAPGQRERVHLQSSEQRHCQEGLIIPDMMVISPVIGVIQIRKASNMLGKCSSQSTPHLTSDTSGSTNFNPLLFWGPRMSKVPTSPSCTVHPPGPVARSRQATPGFSPAPLGSSSGSAPHAALPAACRRAPGSRPARPPVRSQVPPVRISYSFSRFHLDHPDTNLHLFKESIKVAQKNLT